MSFIPLLYRRNKLVSIGVRSCSLECDDYYFRIIFENKEETNTYTVNKTYVSK